MPLIEGQNAAYLEIQLRRFRDRHREGFPMTAVASGFSDEEALSLARLLSTLPWQSALAHPRPRAIERGRSRAEALACSACHGQDYLGIGELPRLAGQDPGYLARQIRGFGAGRRHHPPVGTGARMYELSEEDADDLAAWLHSLGSPESASRETD